MAKIKDLFGQEKEVDCMACDLQSGKVELPTKRIGETKHFVVEQDLEYPIEGFLIIVSKRHIHSILEFNKEEEKEFSEILNKSRKLQKEVLGIEKATIIQEEISDSSHFHAWLFPWHEWMEKKKLENIKELMKYAKENFTSKEHAKKLKEACEKLASKF